MPGGTSRRAVAASLARASLSSACLLTLYFLLPGNPRQTSTIFLLLGAGLAAFLILLSLQVRSILRSKSPVLRAIEVLFTSVTFFLVLFAGIYYVFEATHAAAFSQRLTRVDSLYFTMTVFSTVGFGDITPRAEAARVAVMIQMFMDLIFIGAGIRVLMLAAKRGISRKVEAAHDEAAHAAAIHPAAQLPTGLD